MEFNQSQREISLKLVYYGPGLSGKTTNLQALHDRLHPNLRGRLMRLDTQDDRTLFFDMLPVTIRTDTGLKVKVRLFTVPGQVMHNSTRRIVLQKADGIAFIADGQRSQSRANNEYWQNMTENLRENQLDPDQMPIVIQFNKLDLPDARTPEEIEEIRKKGNEPVYRAVAIRGEGVVETFRGLVEHTLRYLDRSHDFLSKFGISQGELVRQIMKPFQESAPVSDGAAR